MTSPPLVNAISPQFLASVGFDLARGIESSAEENGVSSGKWCQFILDTRYSHIVM
jgi:hypothetical protein